MKGFFKTILRILGFITALVGALAVFDKFTNKNLIENDYLDCSKTQIDLEDLEQVLSAVITADFFLIFIDFALNFGIKSLKKYNCCAFCTIFTSI